METPKI